MVVILYIYLIQDQNTAYLWHQFQLSSQKRVWLKLWET